MPKKRKYSAILLNLSFIHAFYPFQAPAHALMQY